MELLFWFRMRFSVENMVSTSTLDAETDIAFSNKAQVRNVLLLSFPKLKWIVVSHRHLWLQDEGKC